jgi:type IV fimbrial biogenesis protein FimT
MTIMTKHFQINYSAHLLTLTLCQPPKTKGFTLIELLITLALLAILSFIAVPGIQSLIIKNASTTSANQIASLVRYARKEAVFRNTNVTLCPSIDGLSCSNSEWNEGVLLFTDQNSNSKVDELDVVKRFAQPFLNSGSLTWRSLRNKVQFNSRGAVMGTAGSFVYCPDNKDAQMGASLVLSFQGRIRNGHDSNKNGIPETGSNKDIVCS